jgi:nucleotide-binding universal stress UspA family protein
MDSFDPILVPYDGSPHSRAAASTARLLARATGARTLLVHVVPSGADTERGLRADAMLREEAARFDTPVETRVLEGDPPTTLAAQVDHAALVIVGTRGRSPLVGLLLGSVTRYLLRVATRPVLTVHQPVEKIAHVLVGVDAGPGSTSTTRVARALADATHARLTLLHAVVADPEVLKRPEAFGIASDAWNAAIRAHGERVFQPVRPLAGDAAELLVFGLPVDRLRETAARDGADIVVVGRRGGSGLDVDAWFSVAFALAVKGPFATLVV